MVLFNECGKIPEMDEATLKIPSQPSPAFGIGSSRESNEMASMFEPCKDEWK
jgi:hypothetical protein